MSFMALARAAAFRAVIRPAVVLTGVGSITSFGSQIHDLRGSLAHHQTKHYGIRSEEAIEGVVFHHSATRGQSITSISEFHVESRGWPGIGYHFAIGYDGKIYLLNDPLTISYHTKDNNYRNIGVVLIGNYHERPLTPEMEQSITSLIEYLKDKYGIEYVWMHREAGKTICPGNYAVVYLTPKLFGPRPK